MSKYISNIDILFDLKILNINIFNNNNKDNPYKNTYKIIELRNQLKKMNHNLIENISLYFQLSICLYNFDQDVREIDNNYPIASPFYNILLSDDDLHYLVH